MVKTTMVYAPSLAIPCPGISLETFGLALHRGDIKMRIRDRIERWWWRRKRCREFKRCLKLGDEDWYSFSKDLKIVPIVFKNNRSDADYNNKGDSV